MADLRRLTLRQLRLRVEVYEVDQAELRFELEQELGLSRAWILRFQ